MKIILFLVVVGCCLPQWHAQSCQPVSDIQVGLENLRRGYYDFLKNTSNEYTPSVSQGKYDETVELLKQECHYYTSKPGQTKLYGANASFETFPFSAQIQAEKFCSGVIISRKWILASDDPGCMNRFKLIKYGKSMELRATVVKNYTIPSYFNMTSCGLALINVKENMHYGTLRPSACLPWDKNSYSSCQTVSVGSSETWPKVAEAEHCPQPVCQYFFQCGKIALGKQIICFRLTNPHDKFDSGDIGAPIFCNADALPSLAGIYRGIKYQNGHNIFLGVSVEYYLKWIVETIAREGIN